MDLPPMFQTPQTILDTVDPDDPTITTMQPNGAIEATKTYELIDTDGDGETGVGDVVRFIIQLENIGNTALSSITFVDVLTDDDDNVLTLSEEPFFYSSTMSSTAGSKKLGRVPIIEHYLL